MKSEDIFNGVTGIRDDLIERAERYEFRRKKPAHWKRWGALAACLCLAVLGAATLLPRMGASTPRAPDASAGGSGHEEGTVFMSYAGPAFPLTSLGGAAGITAVRDIDFDFGAYGLSADAWDPEGRVYGASDAHAVLRDRYTLRNPTAQDVTFTAVYPYVGSFQTSLHPTITVDGAAVESALHSGLYSGGFRGAGDEHSTSLNLDNIDEWTGYRDLLADGSYFAGAFGEAPALTQPCIVYELTDITGARSDVPAATLGMKLRMDFDRTSVLTYGFNGAGLDAERGMAEYSFFIPAEGRGNYGEARYLIVLGDDIGDYALQGYKDGGCDPGEEIDGAGASVRRFECLLDDVLQDIARQHYDRIWGSEFDGDHNRYLDSGVSFEMYYGEVCRFFSLYGKGGMREMERYSMGVLEDILSETSYHQRVLYRSFEVSVPAGGSVEVCAELLKNGSFDFDCAHTENKGVQGYDLVTRLGSDLDLTAQTASLSNAEHIEIVRQSFGFDLAGGVTSVVLDGAQEHYYLEVRKLPQP